MTDAPLRANFVISNISLVLVILILALPQNVSATLHFELVRSLTLVFERFHQFDGCTCRFFWFKFWFSATAAVARILIRTTLCNVSDIGDWLGPFNKIAYINFVIKLNGRFLITYCRWLSYPNSVSSVFFYADRGVYVTSYQHASTR